MEIYQGRPETNEGRLQKEIAVYDLLDESITDIICENCKYLPTKRSRNKRKPIPKESDVKTSNYTAHLWDIRWLRERARNTR